MDIKKTIKRFGFTSVQVAEALGISKGAFSQIVNRDSVTTKNLESIANVIGCQMKDFFTEDEEAKEAYLICPHCGERIKLSIDK